MVPQPELHCVVPPPYCVVPYSTPAASAARLEGEMPSSPANENST
jgi:hypothetical protein